MINWEDAKVSLLVAFMVLGVPVTLIATNRWPSGYQLPPNTPRQLSHPHIPTANYEIDLTAIKGQLPFDTSYPSILGEPYEVRLTNDNSTLYLIYTMGLIPPAWLNTWILSDYIDTYSIIDHGGLVMTTSENPDPWFDQSMVDRAVWNSDGVLSRVNVSGYPGFIGGNVDHFVKWFSESTVYKITACVEFDLSFLLEIARSVQ